MGNGVATRGWIVPVGALVRVARAVFLGTVIPVGALVCEARAVLLGVVVSVGGMLVAGGRLQAARSAMPVSNDMVRMRII
jgi:hypothetical protein